MTDSLREPDFATMYTIETRYGTLQVFGRAPTLKEREDLVALEAKDESELARKCHEMWVRGMTPRVAFLGAEVQVYGD